MTMLNTKQKKAAQDHLCSEEGRKERKGKLLKLLLLTMHRFH